MRKSNRRMRIGRFIVLWAGLPILLACTPSGLNEACSVVDRFAIDVVAAETYADLADIATWLASDLDYVADISRSDGLRSDVRWAAGAARDVVTVIRSGNGRDIIEFEIDGLVYALDAIRTRC